MESKKYETTAIRTGLLSYFGTRCKSNSRYRMFWHMNKHEWPFVIHSTGITNWRLKGFTTSYGEQFMPQYNVTKATSCETFHEN